MVAAVSQVAPSNTLRTIEFHSVQRSTDHLDCLILYMMPSKWAFLCPNPHVYMFFSPIEHNRTQSFIFNEDL